jgi:hypothetical protein
MRYNHDVKYSATPSVVRETASCECGSLLDFDTDLNGFVTESCRTCHYTRQMQPARPRSALLPLQVPLSEYPCVERCGRLVPWKGYGPRRLRCLECTDQRQRAMSRIWHRKHYGNDGGRAA